MYGKSPNGSVVAQPGSESAGLYGNGTTFGGSYFEWFVFQTSATQPATPTGGSWSFQTDSGTPPSGWTNAPASNPTNPVWISIALVNSKSTSSLVWSTPGVLSYSGTINGSGAPTSGVGQIGELYIQTGVTPNALWFKSGSTTWTQITGSALYVDLTSNQTIAGTKTFSSTVQGDISGNAGTVTNGVYTNGTYVDPAWIASLAGSKITGNISGNAANVTGNVAIVNGGTGATTASGARTNLGLGTIATQDASSVAITGGSITGITDLAIADGGTGASTAGQARTNLGLGTAAVLDAGVANGVATLDSGGTVPLSQIPASIQGGVSYQGAWNASTNTPTLTSSVGTKGYYYVVSTAGSTNLNGVTDWNIGDWAIFNGTVWQKIDNTDAVTSVNGYTGTVVLNANDVGALSNITSTDGSVTITTPSTGVRDLSVAVAGATTNVLCLVRNTTGATLTKGTVVYISGATGQNPTVSKAIATSDATSAQTLGMMTADLANNSNGYVTVIGLITNINTSAYTDGQQLYLSGTTAGAVTGTKPYAPIHLVYVAVVEHAHPTQGKLFVKVQNGYELDELHNVSAQTPTNGQTIVYNSSTQLWENNTVSLSNGVNGTLAVANGGTGASTLTGYVKGNGTSAFTASATVPSGDITGLGTMSTQNANAVAITGGTIDNTTIGATTPSTGVFTTLTGGGGSANYFQTQGSATTKAVEIKALGSDSNVAFVIDSKGTGAIDLAAGSSGVNISNGGTVTAITRTNNGTGYTSFPSIAISAPTTAGGVQAVATIGNMFNISATIQSGGTGYTVNDVLTPTGGTSDGLARLTVTSVSGGVITGISTTGFGTYSVLPSNPVSVTGGTGSSATFNLTYGVSTTGLVVSNAGSGYVEQPTVTFSGGGGSGAAAYATVGSGTIVRGLGSTMSFYTPNGEAVRVNNSSATSNGYLQLSGSTASSNGSYVTSTTGGLYLSSTTSNIRFFTNGEGGTEQLRVAHTASAVNYVQVTGSATGNTPIISVQGSDATRGLQITGKGTTFVYLQNTNGATTHFSAGGTATAVNYLNARGNATGTSPALEAVGSDANIGIVLQTKGTGPLQAQQTDSTATGGNARGANAVDWQTVRTGAATQVASGSTSFIGSGRGNTASSQDSFVGGGYQNLSSSSQSVVAGGANNQATAPQTFVGSGLTNYATRDYSGVVVGSNNSALGYYNFIGGGATNSGTANTAVTTQSSTMNGTTAVTLGASNGSIKVGQLVTGTFLTFPTYVAAVSGTSLTLSQNAIGSGTSTLSFFTPHGVVVGGGNNQATGSYSFIGGGGDAGTAANRNVASGDWSVVGGGQKNTVSDNYSTISGGYGNNISATGNQNTITGGNNNTISGSGVGQASINGGNGNTVSSPRASISGGLSNTANSQDSFIAAGAYATTRSINGNKVFSAAYSPIATSTGVNQACLLVLARQTTDATPTVLASDINAAGTTNQVILPNNSAYYFRGEVVSGVTGGGNTKGWFIEGVIKRGANAASTALVGTPTVTSSYADAGASTWTIAVTADTTNGGLAVTFTGQASTTIRTVAQIRTTEMTY